MKGLTIFLGGRPRLRARKCSADNEESGVEVELLLFAKVGWLTTILDGAGVDSCEVLSSDTLSSCLGLKL